MNEDQQQKTCIFCGKENAAVSIEHIVSESFGNKKYVMEKGKVCDDCNGRFSKFEDKALTNSIFVMERARFGIKTKKGKNVKGKINELKIEGDINFRKRFLNIEGLNADNFKDFNTETKIGNLYVQAFDKSQVATSKLLLKIGLESLYTSQKKIYNQFDFTHLKEYLTAHNNDDWPFLTTQYEEKQFNCIVKFGIKYLLKQKHIELKFLHINDNTLLFKFVFGVISMTINLLNRELTWTFKTLDEDENARIYPEHFKNKIERIRKNPSTK